MDHSVILAKFPQNFLYTQNEEKQSAHLKQTSFKYLNWKLSSQIDFSILKMSKQAPFKYPKLKLSSQMDNGAFVKIITWTFFKKNMKVQSYTNRNFK